MFVKNILSAWSIILIDCLLLFDYREKYSFSSAWSEMMIDGSQVAALRVVWMMVMMGHSCKIGNMRCPGTLKNQNPQFEEKK